MGSRSAIVALEWLFYVPGAGFRVDGSRYFWYHHTAADTADKLDPEEVQRGVAAMAIFAYVVAEMPEALPR